MSAAVSQDLREYVTLVVGDYLFGAEVSRVRDVFDPQNITPVPLAPKVVAGLLNLRGRIVTAIEARERLGMPGRPGEAPRMAVGVERNDEYFSLIVDGVGEVLKLDPATIEANPSNLDTTWKDLSTGVYQLDGKLLIALDLERMLDCAPVH
ncbi:MAG TPA: chemotaxis protein CheW [Hyphomonadaceae bacterium]|nr:chemotaxis protein CheW [Hyphomonadaceae bacterium]